MRFLSFLISLILIATIAFSQTITGSFTSGGQTRTYSVYLPVNFNSATSLPLMINMHGRGSTGSQQQIYSQMDAVADTGRFIVAYPNAVTYQGEVQWNSFGLSNTPDDVGFISALIDTLYRRYNIDLSRVYATGLSSGGFMSYKLACALSCRIAAIAPVAGLLIDHPLAPCNLSRPVALFHIHGTNDATVPYTGLGTFGVYSVNGSVAAWRSKIGCPSTPVVTNLPNTNTSDNSTVIDTTYTPCNSSTEITLYAITNGGHTWPDGAINLPGLVTNRDFNASSEIWKFVKRYNISAASLSITGLATSYCSSASAVTMTGTPSGGTFSGSGVSGSTFNPSGLSPGNYPITYTRSSGGCSYYTIKTVTITAAPTASIAPATATICGGSVTLTASGGTSYLWSTGATTADITVSPASTTSYTVTVTSGGCTATASRTVTVTSGLTATISPSNASVCNGENVTLTASGGTNYSWSSGGATASISVSPVSTTTYTVTVTDASGSCSATASQTVTVNSNPIAAITPESVSVCNGESATLTASGGTTYVWSTTSTNLSVTVTPSSVSTYAVTVTDANGCSSTATSTVNVYGLPQASATANPASIQQGGSSTLTATGGTTYQWSSGETAASFTVTPDSTTAYSVTVTDANGCTASALTSVMVLPSGINEALNGISFSLHPNPTRDVLSFEFKTGYSSLVGIEIYSLTGKKLHTENLQTSSTSSTVTLSLKKLQIEPGVYFINIRTGEITALRKIVLLE